MEREPFFRAILSGERRGFLAAAARALLFFLSLFYRAALALRGALVRPRRAPCAVVSVGNLTAGGTGKTPLVEHVARALAQGGRRVAILARGYGARRGEPNDEALVLAENLPSVPQVIDPNRLRGARRAAADLGAEVVVLDDGFQHRRLARDADIVLIDALDPWGFGHLLPRGLLREPLAMLRRADLVLMTRADLAPEGRLEEIRARVKKVRPDLPVGEVIEEVVGIEPLAPAPTHRFPRPGSPAPAGPLYAFCGIGNPDSFFRRLEAHGLRLAGRRVFRDHHAYRAADLERLAAGARAAGAAALVTTQKDAVKLASLPPPDLPVFVLKIRAALRSGGDDLSRVLDNALRHRP